MATTESNLRRFWRTPWRIALWVSATSFLALPAIAMQFTDEVNWQLGDFAVFGVMIALVVGGIELLSVSKLKARSKIIGVCAVLALFLLVWIELAVGIFD